MSMRATVTWSLKTIVMIAAGSSDISILAAVETWKCSKYEAAFKGRTGIPRHLDLVTEFSYKHFKSTSLICIADKDESESFKSIYIIFIFININTIDILVYKV